MKRAKLHSILLIGLGVLAGWPTGGLAGPVDDRLAAFIGKPAADVAASFGTASVMATRRWSYAYNPFSVASPPYLPEPADAVLGANGGRVGIGTGSPRSRKHMPCEIDFQFDTEGMVTQVSHHGPGCFEIVFSRTKPPLPE